METTQSRKADHIRICLEEQVESGAVSTGLENYRFRHCALPNLDYDRLDLSTKFLGKTLQAPILISSMTGGTTEAQRINRNLAKAAQKYGLAMGVGSQRVAIEQPEVNATFAMRDIAPDILLFANLGAVQFNYGYGLEQCEQAVETIGADGLILHLNPLQECVQSHGDRNFAGLLTTIEQLCQQLSVPIIIKEVGNGISGELAQALIQAGVQAIDVAGAGGTSWAMVEGWRSNDPIQRRLGQTFAHWGLPTSQCIQEVRKISSIPLIASGGIRHGLDIAKCLALGADLVGLASPFLRAAHGGETQVEELIEVLMAELKTVLFCTETATVSDLISSASLEPLS
ncbi:MAG: type 2 isopentenyl-diphosphate Delta-isomerase [Synechococcaceae cyanobacterium RL_1_2]|nr:type 2 isopentenyl-diphosphate Delta-isomerase [Synechococcaceae cyanobacterium RL_1_2]